MFYLVKRQKKWEKNLPAPSSLHLEPWPLPNHNNEAIADKIVNYANTQCITIFGSLDWDRTVKTTM